jgi:hypothetical protein
MPYSSVGRRVACAVLVLVIVGVACPLKTAAAQVGDFNFRNFQNRPHLNLNGDSSSQTGELALTLPQLNQAGAIWFDEALDLSKGFDSSFTFSITQSADAGADGLAMVFQQDSPYALGRGGKGLGYDGLGKGFAVELDTHRDIDLDDPVSKFTRYYENEYEYLSFFPFIFWYLSNLCKKNVSCSTH